MSLILEALRKSEAQRRLGQAPDLMAQMPASERTARRAFPAWPWFLAGLVLVALTAWWLGRQHAPDEGRPGATNGSSAPVGADANGEGSTGASTDPGAVPAGPPPNFGPSPGGGARETLATEPARLPSPSPAPAPNAGPPEPANVDPAPRQLPPATTAAVEGPASTEELARLRARLEAISQRETRPSAVGAETEPAPGPDQAGRQRAEPAASDPPANQSAEAAPGTAEQPPERPSAAGPGQAVELPRFAELSIAERADTPNLSFSLHVFSENPQSRFVIFKDRRLSEGAQISARIRLIEIRRDGAVVEIDGRPVLVSRP